MPSFAFKATKWTLDLATRIIRSDVRMHNVEAIQDDMAILFVVNHFTRLETLLLPYEIYKNTGLEVWSLAADELFVGRIGDYLRSTGNLSTKDPDRDRIMVGSLLSGANPWIIFPEGQMIKDKKVIGPQGAFQVFNRGKRRPPHTGPAALALRAEFYRHKLECLKDRPSPVDLSDTLQRFGLVSIDQALGKRTVIIPVNVTYFPIRARDNVLVRAARGFLKDTPEKMIEELSVEGTILSADTDIDITLGAPIDIRDYLMRTEYAELMACGENDLEALERDPRSLFNEAVDELMFRYMRNIYDLTTINYDHLFATLVRHQGRRRFTERSYRNRIFLCAHELKKLEKYRLHGVLDRTYRAIIYEDPSPKFKDFTDLCIQEGYLEASDGSYRKVPRLKRGKADFHRVRMEEITQVIANEIEPLKPVTRIVEKIAAAPRRELSKRIRKIFFEEDLRLYNQDRRRFPDQVRIPLRFGKPFLVVPNRLRGGVVLVHGYLSAPEEIRPLADYLFRKGFAVYGVRLKGHGTTPEDLAATAWEEWYESVNRGYTVIKTLTNRIVLGGFSTGGGLALLAAGKKGAKVESVFSISAPLHLRRMSARFASSLATLNDLLKRVKGQPFVEFVDHVSEKPTINYNRNPIAGVRELAEAMDAVEAALPNVEVPTLILQSSNDPIVSPESGQTIFNKVGTDRKVLTILERNRHGILRGPGAEDIFDRVHRFIVKARRKHD
jgi:esterase/lipase/1-acyl-sn-glycerol-3-phosphate acyltransferase